MNSSSILLLNLGEHLMQTIDVYIYIRRPRPSPRQGRRLGPPEVWNLLCHSPLFLRHSSLPFARLQTLKTLKTLQIPRTTCHQAPSNAQSPYNPPTAALLPRGSCHQALWPSAFAVPGLQPALCLHIPRGTPSSWKLPSSDVQALGSLQPLNCT